MTERVQKLNLRLFIEGIEVPCVSAQISVTPNSPCVASIQILPLAEGTRFLPRSIVHLFFLDFYEDTNPYMKSHGTYDPNPGPNTYDKEVKRKSKESTASIDEDLQAYKLLFLGEVMGFRWSKGSINRALILQCSDLSNYWDYAYQFSNTDIFGPSAHALFSGQSTNLFTDFLDSNSGMVTKKLLTPSSRFPGLKGLLGGLVHVLESIGGSYYSGKQYRGMNLFFSMAELRLHLTHLIMAYTKDPTASRLMGGSYEPLFGRTIGALGDQVSYRMVVSKLAGCIFHEVFPQSCPMYTPGTGGTISGFERKKPSDLTELADIASRAKLRSQELVKVGLLPNGNVPKNGKSKAKELSDQLVTLTSTLKTSKLACDRDAQKAESVVPTVRRAYGPNYVTICRKVSMYEKVASMRLSQAMTVLKYNKGKITSYFTKFVNQAVEELNKIDKLEVEVTVRNKAIPAILKQQVFRPDVWFSAPIRCNVLFPDGYQSYEYTRSFMSEPTRLLLKTHDEFFGEDELFDKLYFAPKAITLKGQKNTLASIIRNDVLDHELFTGIIPVFEKMGEFNIFAARSGLDNGKQTKLGLAQRSTNFLFFKYRFSARQMQINAKFNPYVACGFPGLVIDKYIDLDTLRLHNELKRSLPGGEGFDTKVPSLLGTHFLGSFTEVSHVINYGSGSTSISCSYPRQVEESVEFLGVEQETIHAAVSASKKKVATVSSVVATITPPRVGMQGPGRGRITAVTNVTARYTKSKSPTLLPLLDGKRDKKTGQLITRVPIGVSKKAKDYGKEVIELAGDSEIFITMSAYEITETKARYYDSSIYLPPEEYIRPGWYGDCWHPAKISEPYHDFFGIGAITEITQVENKGHGGTEHPMSTSNAKEALAAVENDVIHSTRDELIRLSMAKGASIQDAVAFLVLTYSVLKHSGLDAEQFIRSYTWRPIASMLDMFGSRDLELDASGKEVVHGIEGFHSRAFGPYEDLFGLVTPDIESIVGIRRNSLQSQKGDTRKRKRQAVLDYVSVIKLSRGILG